MNPIYGGSALLGEDDLNSKHLPGDQNLESGDDSRDTVETVHSDKTIK